MFDQRIIRRDHRQGSPSPVRSTDGYHALVPISAAQPAAKADPAVARWLDALYQRYHHRRFVEPDPLQLLYRYDAAADREVAGLVAACLAYGNVRAILRGIGQVLDLLGSQPATFVREHQPQDIRRLLRQYRYRVTPGEQLAALLIAVRAAIRDHGSLNQLFLDLESPDDATVLPALGRWIDRLCQYGGASLHHLLPHPARGSACKRPCLYLRWMVRRDAVDPGGWTGIDPAMLVVPLDTHMQAVARRLRFTNRKSMNLRAAIDMTDALRTYDAADPLRFDFALTRPGIRRESWPGGEKP